MRVTRKQIIDCTDEIVDEIVNDKRLITKEKVGLKLMKRLNIPETSYNREQIGNILSKVYDWSNY